MGVVNRLIVGFPARAAVHRSRSSRRLCSAPMRPFVPPKRPTPDNESDKARSMSGFKEPSFADRQKAAQEARQDILNKFRSQPGLDDPAVAQPRAERAAQAAERAQAQLGR